MNQNAQKEAAALAAVDYILPELTPQTVVGVGTGSTTNYFIEGLVEHRARFKGAVASSDTTAGLLHERGIAVLDLNAVDAVRFYVDGADEANPRLELIKGGGAALTREKIVAASAEAFVCIADASKPVDVLGRFPLPVEVIPMARAYVARQLVALGGDPVHRQGVTTDNGNDILDVHGLHITNPVELETAINQIAGVVAHGIFARRPADLLLLGTNDGVKHMRAQ